MHQLTQFFPRPARPRIATTGILVLLAGILIPTGAIAPTTAAAQAAGPRSHTFVAVAPCQVAKTKLKPKKTVTRKVTGTCGVPADATSVVLGLEARKATRTSRAAVWPAGGPRPATATLAWTRPARSATGHATVKLPATGALSLWNKKGKVKVNVEVQGYYVPVETVTTLSVDPSAMALRGSLTATKGTTNGCATNVDSAATTGIVSLALPVGARILSISTAVYDGTSADAYELTLLRFVTGQTNLILDGSTTLGSGGAGSVVINHTQTTINHVVAADETFAIHMSNLKSFNNGLCQVFVTYDPAG